MAEFKIGDKVRIRLDANSQFRGRIGTVENEPNDNESATVVGYMVKFESKGNTSTCLFDEQVLEAISDK
jgi:ribosomal protein L21E